MDGGNRWRPEGGLVGNRAGEGQPPSTADVPGRRLRGYHGGQEVPVGGPIDRREGRCSGSCAQAKRSVTRIMSGGEVGSKETSGDPNGEL